ncbi:MAG: class I SAM-dependent methyltransferase [Nocardioidaceae bacterium]
MLYLDFLDTVHHKLRPERYLEIGVRKGKSLELARCRAVGIDPAFSIETEVNTDVALFRTTSDEYFRREAPLDATGGLPFDLSFIDGMHLFEFALRDFLNAERHSSPGGVIVFDDVLPRSVDEAARERHTTAWTGDVYPMVQVLATYRPELVVLPVATQPTGLLVVAGLDPENTVLTDSYDEIMREHRVADPQPVPEVLLDRLMSLPPQRVLDSSLWEVLAEERATPSGRLRDRLQEVVSRELGTAFARPATAQ